MSYRVRGFTLVEASIVLLVLCMMAAIATPSAVAFKRSQQERAFFHALYRLPGQAREAAISNGGTVTLTYNDAQNQFELQLQPANSTVGGNTTGSNSQSTTYTQSQNQMQTDTPFRTLAVVDPIKVTRQVLGTQDVGSGDWKINFYPDGTCDGGGLELDSNGQTLSMAIKASTCEITTSDQALADPTQQKWQAGDYVRHPGQ